jgi:Flp pilus assembly protein TadD
MLEDNPNDFNAHLGLVNVLPHLGRIAEAQTHLKAAVQNCPDEPEALNNLAWTLATSGEAGLRDGTQAVKCAERACELTGHRETVMVGTLGAAYAEAGRFDEAIAMAQKACALAAATGKADLLKINQQLLELYRRHQPYRETASSDQPEETTTNPPPDNLTR